MINAYYADFNAMYPGSFIWVTSPVRGCPMVGNDVLIGDCEGNYCLGKVMGIQDYRLGAGSVVGAPTRLRLHVALDMDTWMDGDDVHKLVVDAMQARTREES
jgi:hypothetical protein